MWSLFNNDWKLIYAISGNWSVEIVDVYYKDKVDRGCWYEVWYSEHRNKCKVVVGGHDPKNHKLYGAVVERMNKWLTEKQK